MREKPDPEVAEAAEKYEPCPEEWMEMENPRYTICEILREIYQATDNPRVRIRARIAMTMAKKMVNKLLFHYHDKHSESWDGRTDEMRKKLG